MNALTIIAKVGKRAKRLSRLRKKSDTSFPLSKSAKEAQHSRREALTDRIERNLDIAALVGGMTATAKSQAESNRKKMSYDIGKPFIDLPDERIIQSPGTGGLNPIGPSVSVSFFISRSYLSKYGYTAGRKLPAVVAQQVNEFVRVYAALGFLQISVLNDVLTATTGVASINAALIDEKPVDLRLEPIKCWPSYVRLFDVSIDEAS